MFHARLAAIAAVVFTVALVAPAMADKGDVAGSKDYAGIGRFAGSVITGYDARDFDAAVIEAAPFKDGKPQDMRKLEGRVTRIAYKTEAGPSIVEVSRNFEEQLLKAGYKQLLKCDTDECGGTGFVEKIDVLPIPQMWVDGFNFHYFSARNQQNGQDTYASVVVSKNNDQIYAELVVVQLKTMENKMVDAAAMAKGLGDKGHIALYGIYFDTDKTTLKPESRPTLDEIAKLLKSQPKLAVYIVGHTDNQGSYDYNMNLSRGRAQSVAADLVAHYGIDKARLKTAGVGFLAPVASNATDAGRALNRRTELVEP
ncbi:MAG TPA: OmpA family protein [Rhizomicrobium sp.]|nr:OmpA family protein [Rhizomicrobium sp.]